MYDVSNTAHVQAMLSVGGNDEYGPRGKECLRYVTIMSGEAHYLFSSAQNSSQVHKCTLPGMI